MRRLVFLTFLFSFLFAQTYDSEIQPIFNNNCTSCHGTSGNLDLSQGNSYTNLVNVASSGYSGFQRVKPGDPMNSVLHQKIVGNTSYGDRMPQGGSALAQADEEKIKNWIQNGAVKDWSGGSGGVVTTLAGSGSGGSADGTGTEASFYIPIGVAVDGSGNVYVADQENHLIRKIATTLPSGSTTNDATLPLIFTSSEATSNFAVGDITITNGALSSFSATSSPSCSVLPTLIRAQ